MISPSWNSSGAPRRSRSGSKTASNTSLIDWDKGVLNYVYSCMHPPSYYYTQSQFQATNPQPSRSAAFLKAHRRIVSATSPHVFLQAPPGVTSKPSRLAVSRVRGHCRNASDPGMHIYFPPPPPIFIPPSTTTLIDEKGGITTPQFTSPSPPLPPSPPSQQILPPDRIDNVEKTVLSPKPILSDIGDSACLVSCLQPWATSLVLLISLCAMSFFQSLVSSGYLSSIITTLERRFDLTSRQVGYMYCCYEITSVLATIGFSFVNAARTNRPRIVGILGLVLGAGFGLFALPHWLSGPYNPGKVAGMQNRRGGSQALCSELALENATSLLPPFIDQSHCNQTEVTILKIGEEAVIASDYTVALPLFCCAMALAGFGSSSLFVLAPTFFWDNLPPEQYPLYSGLLYSSAGLGPAFGFMAGAAFLQIYIDAPSIQPPASQLDVYSQSWLGAWWLGMVIFGVVTCLPAIPVLLFPRRLPARAEVGVSMSLEPTTVNTTTLSAPENDEVGAGEPRAYPPSNLPGRFPEPIPESNESLALHLSRQQSSLSTSCNPEVDYKIHRRQASRGDTNSGVFQMTSSQQQSVKSIPLSASSQPSTCLSTTPSKHRKDKGFSFSRWRSNFSRKYRGRMGVFLRVVKNPIWLGVTATTVTENIIVSAYLTYAAKYLQAQFRVPAHLASIHTGAVVVPSAVLGVLSGALLMRYFRPSITRTLLAVLLPLFATLATVLILMLGLNCSANQMAGVSATYDGKPNRVFGGSFLHHPSNLTAPCNAVCRVRPDHDGNIGRDDSLFTCPLASDYNPVCWESLADEGGSSYKKRQMSFLNPCLAGCSGQSYQVDENGKTIEVYTDCNCVTNSTLAPLGVHFFGERERIVGGTAKQGVCDPLCPNYVPFLIVTFLTIFLTSVNQNPSNVVTLSCVDPKDGTAALGLQVFFARTLAFIPTPIYFGALMDRTCKVRALPQRLVCESYLNSSSSQSSPHLLLLSAMKLAPLEGACLEYDVHALPFAWLGGVTVFKCLSIFVALLTWRYSCRSDARQEKENLSMLKGDDSPERQYI
nr:Solute carrier organic anion transporter family [Hymenolepis microstoma]